MSTTPDIRDDAALLSAAADGDRDAFATFYRRHLPAVARVLLAETRDRELAADLAADVFAVALQSAGRYRPEHDDALPWLRGIARNKAAEARRQGRSRERLRRRLAGAREEAISEDDLERVEQLAAHDGRLLALLEQLPAAQREALHARVIDERDYAEIARAQGSSEEAVRQRVSRGLAWLRAHATVAGATFLATALAAAAALVIWVRADEPPTPTSPPRSLPAALAVLRRPQQPGDAPAKVVAKARETVRAVDAPFAGSVDPARMRLLADAHGAGMRAYLVPVTAPGASAGRERAALLLFADRGGRRVFRPVGVTAAALRGGALYTQIGLRSVPGRGRDGLERMRALQLQLVPDGVASADYEYHDGLGMVAGPTRTVRASGDGNAIALMLRGRAVANPHPLSITLRDGAGTVVERALPSLAGRGEISPEAFCAGHDVRPGPARRPRIEMVPERDGAAQLCASGGLPLHLFRRDAHQTIALYPDGALVLLTDGRIHGLTNMRPDEPWPPPLVETLPSAPLLNPSR